MDNLESLKKMFTSEELFKQALTHRSWLNENSNAHGSNERLEFLGDAVLEYVVSDDLYRRFPDKEEGYLTALRASLVNTVNLAGLAKRLKIGELLLLSKGEEEGGGRNNSSILADTVEAIIGAIFLDQGLDSATGFIAANILVDVPAKIEQPLKDAKSRLQEMVQAEELPTPKYRVVSEEGPDHNKEFVIEVVIDSKVWGQGKGKSKAVAEQEAAEDALTARLVKKP